MASSDRAICICGAGAVVAGRLRRFGPDSVPTASAVARRLLHGEA